jgi:micrococcal nuclease|tara:strand:- start:933 stop:1379 length:447 start_codon:yes stop_codon:yes gene_type:complete
MYEYSCQVTRVVDGDTIDCILDLGFSVLHKCRVRLYGIDTPESRTRDKDEKVRGKLAAKFLEDSINSGKNVVLRSKLKDSKGKYGRVLGEVVVDGININVAMIEKYLAVAYHGQSKSDIEAEHLKNREKLIELGVYTPNEQGAGSKKT